MPSSSSPRKKPFRYSFSFGPDAVICKSEDDECWTGPPILVVAFARLNGVVHYILEFTDLVGARKRIALPATVCISSTRFFSALAAAGYLVPPTKLRAAFGDALLAEPSNAEVKIQLRGAGPEFIELSGNEGSVSSAPSPELVTPAPQEKPPSAPAKVDVCDDAAGHRKLDKASDVEQEADAPDTAKDWDQHFERAAARAIASAVYRRVDNLDHIADVTDPSHVGLRLRRNGHNKFFVRMELLDEAIDDVARRRATIRGLANRGIIMRHQQSESRIRTVGDRSIRFYRVNLARAREYAGSENA